MKRQLLFLILWLQVPASLRAACSFDDQLRNIAKAGDAAIKEQMISRMLNIRLNLGCYQSLLVDGSRRPAYTAFVKDLEALRTDKQAGSSAGTGGSTNLVSKGIGSEMLSLATEYGALTQSTSNQTATFKGSLDGAAAVLIRKDILAYCPVDSEKQPGCLHARTYDFLRRFSYQVSFYTTQNSPTVSGSATGKQTGTAQPATFSASGHQLAAISGQIILSRSSRKIDTQSFENAVAQNDFLSKAAVQIEDAMPNVIDVFIAHDGTVQPAYQQWVSDTQTALANAPSEQDLKTEWAEAAAKLLNNVVPTLDSSLAAKMRAFSSSMSEYRFEEDNLINTITDQPILTFEYDENRPLAQPSNSVFRLIYNQGFGKWSLTGNAAGAIYDSQVPTSVPGASRFRDAQAALQVQYNLGTLQYLGAAALSGAYYFQYQNSPAILNVTPGMPLPGITFTGLPSTATQVFAQKGNLHIAQLRLELGTGKANARIPISVSYSNRTELIAKPEWRAQIGISYDFDSLFAK